MILPVPYRSQLAADAGYGKGDCGPASFAMILLRLLIYITVDALGKIMGKPANYTIAELRELQQLAKEFRVTLQWKGRMSLDDVRARIEARQPIIALVWYPFLPIRFDPGYVNGHFVVIVGVEEETIVYHDPYFKEAAGATLRSSWSDFSRAWSATGKGAFNTPRQGLIAPPLPVPVVEQGNDVEVVRAARWWAEEGVRKLQDGQLDEARRILLDEAITRLYVLEGSARVAQKA